MKPLTAKTIQIGLYWHLRGASDLMIPRYTPRDWWECDLWRLTKAAFVDEYEIKLTVSDFRADRTKSMSAGATFDLELRKYVSKPAKNKHEMLATHEGGPNRFWFVIPDPMRHMVMLPSWAGLITVSPGGQPRIRTDAPKRHNRKWEGNRIKLMDAFYHRYWAHECRKPDQAIEPLLEAEKAVV